MAKGGSFFNALCGVLAAAWFAGTQVAIAQTVDGSGDAPAQAGYDAEAARAADAEADAAWEAAMGLLWGEDFAAARAALQAFVAAYPDDRRVVVATQLAQGIGPGVVEAAPTAGEPALPVDPGPPVGSRAGRAHAVSFATVWGAGTGALLGLGFTDAIDSDRMVPVLVGAGLGSGLGLGLSLLGTREQSPTTGQALLASSAAVWGYVLGTELITGTGIAVACTTRTRLGGEESEDCEVSSVVLALLPAATSALALGTAWAYASGRHVSTDDVAFVNAVGLWTTLTALHLRILLTDFNAMWDGDAGYFPSDAALVGSVVGLLGGVWLASGVDVPRSRLLGIHVAGGLGLGLGMTAAGMLEVDTMAGWGVLMLVGQTAGLLTGALITADAHSSTSLPLEALQISPILNPRTADGMAITRGLSLHATW